ncbi:MAG TPA: hypothetical protein VN239_00025 [Nitrososphaera sp.]|jgi:hypothetical protein|nr:hypothetical protein [Nitrososphaera sp.]
MSEYRFTDGNLLVLYAIHKTIPAAADGELPDYVKERIKVGLETYGMIMRSRPDKYKTMVMIVGAPEPAQKVREELVKGGIRDETIAVDTDSQNMAQTISRMADMIKTKPNPPFIYFIGSVWLHDVFKSTVLGKLKGYRVQFYGALDHRPVEEVEKEKALDVPKKSMENYKQQAKNKAVDMLLDIVFPD